MVIKELSGAPLANLQTLVHARPNDDAVLYGIVDSAADPMLYTRLKQEPEISQITCLFDGHAALSYAAVAPYLMTINLESPLTRDWLAWGWRLHWGVWLSSCQPIDRIKMHLKKFLFVKKPGGRSYFRYYDPRVLPQAMKIFTDHQCTQFFSNASRITIDAWFATNNHVISPYSFAPSDHSVELACYRLKNLLLDRITGISSLRIETLPWDESEAAPDSDTKEIR